MKWPEVEVNTEYQVHIDRYESAVKVLVISKTMEVPAWEKKRIRQVAAAKAEMWWRNKVTGDTTRHAWATRNDGNWEEVETWHPIWLPINKIVRTWEEHAIEMEIQAEIERESRSAAEKRQEEERRKQEQQQLRIQEVNKKLAALFPDKGYSTPRIEKRFGNTFYLHHFDLEAMEKLLEQVSITADAE